MKQQDQQSEALTLPSDVPSSEEVRACTRCGKSKPINQFLRSAGRSGRKSRRAICRTCRKKAARQRKAELEAAQQQRALEELTLPVKVITRRPMPKLPPKPKGPDASILRPTAEGIIRMRGQTDKGRRWYQETDLETAQVLVREFAAVVLNPHSIRRIYSNKRFKEYILNRDHYRCHYCGEYGDTIDHLLPRSKGGHTTPVNCVCACHLCNQNKANLSVDEFLEGAHDGQ